MVVYVDQMQRLNRLPCPCYVLLLDELVGVGLDMDNLGHLIVFEKEKTQHLAACMP